MPKSTSFRRDNERLRREAKKAAEKAQEQTERAEQLEQKMKRYNENIRERADGWAERKKLEDELRAVRQRLAVAEEQTAELNDKLERRDRLIEKIGRGHSDQAGTVEKIRAELNAARQREAAATRAEAGLKHENLVLQERLRECGVRADSAMKQNHALRARLQRSTSSVEVQTPAEWLRADEATAVWDVRGSARPPKNLQAARPVDSPPRLRTPTSELKCAEFREQLEDLQEEYDRLDEEYTRFKRIRNSPRAQTSASVVILEDKLKGKQREINKQQKRIEELEDTIQRWRLST
ncbi:hypothetical protein M3Y99_00958400 [Aphelenchoides fujianensis]|nr:hypothetical protein M3Y99_00958400 [Aphelenchoides fujianensis]